MHLNFLHSLLFLLILPIRLSSSSNSIDYSQDFGKIIQQSPISVLKPPTVANISLLLKSLNSFPTKTNVTVAPRGSGHSTYGQPLAHGIIVDMRSLPSYIRVDETCVDASGGTLWVDVLKETLKYGLSPRSWTDYLYLTIGGTLSNAGISGQTFKFGPQISNIIELEVVTGTGEIITCSEQENSDLFYGVLGGLGQLGIITRARIILQPAPKMVKRVEVPYDDFNQFMNDQELLISNGVVDYLEGSIILGGNSSSTNYIIELAIYYNDEDIAEMKLDQVLSQLGFARSMVNATDVSYFEFLNRVRAAEEELRKKGLWDVAHPWLNIFVPRANIERFKDLLIETISDSFTGGPIIIYPFLRNKWNLKMSAMLPEVNTDDDIVYAVSMLQSAPPSCTHGSQCLDELLTKNRNIIDIATYEPIKHQASITITRKTPATALQINKSEAGLGAKQYLPYWKNEGEWRTHFGDKWGWFKKLKNKFDPLHILTPGQRIFTGN